MALKSYLNQNPTNASIAWPVPGELLALLVNEDFVLMTAGR
jgi:hypothetical protein